MSRTVPTVADREKWLEKFVEDYMVHDVEVCIKGNANFTVALALSVYTEVLGGLVNGSLTISGNSARNYITFLERMGYTDPVKREKYYSEIRCGLAHQYFVKGESTVAIDTLERTSGIYERDGVTYFLAEPYFHEFRDAYYLYKKDLQTDPTLQANFDKAIGDQTIPSPVRKILDPSTPSLSYAVSGGGASVISASTVIFVPFAHGLGPESSKSSAT